jgi:hypothetical protein
MARKIRGKFRGKNGRLKGSLLRADRAQVSAHKKSAHHAQEDSMTYERLVTMLYVADSAGICSFAKDEYEAEVTTSSTSRCPMVGSETPFLHPGDAYSKTRQSLLGVE